jgi:hypothetical protein
MGALLHRAAARTGGGLSSLHVDGRHFLDERQFTYETLLAVVTANAGALEELRVSEEQPRYGFQLFQAEALLLRAAPQLRVFATNVRHDDYEDVDVQDVGRALRNEAPFGPLRIRKLYTNFFDRDYYVNAFAADVATHASLTGLSLEHAPFHTPAALDAVVDAALARRLQSVGFESCGLTPASVPALVYLLSSDALTSLECWGMHPLDAPAAGALAAALRANNTLTSLALHRAHVFAAAAGAALLGALTGHASVRALSLRGNAVPEENQAAAGAALGALVAANAPSLTKLDVGDCLLNYDGLRPLFEALRHNTHLQELSCLYNDMSEACAHDVLLPAVRANGGLRVLRTQLYWGVPSALAAEHIVNSRPAA